MIVELGTDYFLSLWFLLCNIVMSLCIYKACIYQIFSVCVYDIVTVNFSYCVHSYNSGTLFIECYMDTRSIPITVF